MFYKGYVHSPMEQEKAKIARQTKNGSAICVGCGIRFVKYMKDHVTCGKKECMQKRMVQRYESSKSDPVSYLSIKLFSTIRLGNGKKNIAYNFVKNALHKKCPYCETVITLENASVDHKIPRTGSKVFDRRKRRMIYTKEEIQVLDNKKNIHIVCRDCNQTKGNMSHDQFVELLEFLNQRPSLKKILFHRLKLTGAFFCSR